MKKNSVTYISEYILGTIIPAIYICIFVYYLYKSNAVLSIPIKGIPYIKKSFGDYGDYVFWIFYLVVPLVMIFLNGIFCVYKKIDWKIPIIIIMLIFNYFSFTIAGIIQPLFTFIYFVVHVTGYFVGRRMLNKKYYKQGL